MFNALKTVWDNPILYIFIITFLWVLTLNLFNPRKISFSKNLLPNFNLTNLCCRENTLDFERFWIVNNSIFLVYFKHTYILDGYYLYTTVNSLQIIYQQFPIRALAYKHHTAAEPSSRLPTSQADDSDINDDIPANEIADTHTVADHKTEKEVEPLPAR